MIRYLPFLFALALPSCSREPDSAGRSPEAAASAQAASGGEAWLLAGSNDERFARVARQLRGFDAAMVETGYRYGELYWAGQDENWDYAKYQIEKIRVAVRNGVERRPKRGPSAQMLEGALAQVEAAARDGDRDAFPERFGALTATCNACHQAERVPFVQVRPPTIRTSPVHARLGDGGER